LGQFRLVLAAKGNEKFRVVVFDGNELWLAVVTGLIDRVIGTVAPNLPD
jgi:hypothetical protein